MRELPTWNLLECEVSNAWDHLSQKDARTDLLVGSGLAPLEQQRRPLLVLLEDVVVEEAAHRRRRPRAARAHGEPADVPRDEVVVEEEVLRVLDVEPHGGLARREVAVERRAVGGELVPLHRDDGVDLARGDVLHGATL